MEAKEITLHFMVKVTETNINVLKKLTRDSVMVDTDDCDFDIGEEVPINYTLRGNLSDNAVSMAMLFNGHVVGKPYIRLGRGDEESSHLD